MKVTISVPDVLVGKTIEFANRLGISINELFILALIAYLSKVDDEIVTAQLNRVYENSLSSLDPVIEKMQFISLPGEDWT
jgi:hypothetical protein